MLKLFQVSEALSATVTSGIRSFYCYDFTVRVKEWSSEVTLDTDIVPQWYMEQLEELAKDQPFGDGQVYLGWGFDLLFLPKEMVSPMYNKVRELGIKLITSHMGKNAVFGE